MRYIPNPLKSAYRHLHFSFGWWFSSSILLLPHDTCSSVSVEKQNKCEFHNLQGKLILYHVVIRLKKFILNKKPKKQTVNCTYLPIKIVKIHLTIGQLMIGQWNQWENNTFNIFNKKRAMKLDSGPGNLSTLLWVILTVTNLSFLLKPVARCWHLLSLCSLLLCCLLCQQAETLAFF